jgi:hypothetical protein
MNDSELIGLANSLSNRDVDRLVNLLVDRFAVWHRIDGELHQSRLSHCYLDGAMISLVIEPD